MGNICGCTPEFCEGLKIKVTPTTQQQEAIQAEMDNNPNATEEFIDSLVKKYKLTPKKCLCVAPNFIPKHYSDEYVTLLISGYIKTIYTTSNIQNIPIEINSLCSRYYSKYIGKVIISKKMENNEQKIASKSFEIYSPDEGRSYPLKLIDSNHNTQNIELEITSAGCPIRRQKECIIHNISNIPHCFQPFKTIPNNKKYNLLVSMYGTWATGTGPDRGNVILFDTIPVNNMYNGYCVSFTCDMNGEAGHTGNRFSWSSNMLFNDIENENIYSITGENVYKFDLGNFKQTELEKKLLFYHEDAAVIRINDDSVMIMGGSVNWQHVIPKEYIKINKKCHNYHNAINLCEIYNFSDMGKKSKLVSNMISCRAKAGCVYNKFSKNIIVGGGLHFFNYNHPSKKVFHYNHTFEIYDIMKDQWRTLTNKLRFNYGEFPTLWMDLRNPMIVYIMNKEVDIEFIDMRENVECTYFVKKGYLDKHSSVMHCS